MLFPAVASVICKTADKKEEQLMDVCAKAVCFIDVYFLNEYMVVSFVLLLLLLFFLLFLGGEWDVAGIKVTMYFKKFKLII